MIETIGQDIALDKVSALQGLSLRGVSSLILHKIQSNFGYDNAHAAHAAASRMYQRTNSVLRV